MRVKILKAITAIAWIVLLISALSMDSPDIRLPICGFIASICWLVIMMTVNSYDLNKYNGQKKKYQHCNADTSKRIEIYTIEPNPLYQNHTQKAIHVEEFKKRFREHL